MSGKIIIGVTGEIGAGKTTVVKELEKFNIHPIYADEISHKVLKLKKVKTLLNNRFGKNILKNNEIIPKNLAEKAFRNKENWEKLIYSTHPYIVERISKTINTTSYEYYAIDAPLLFESNMDELCDFIILVKAPYATRIKRITKRLNRKNMERRSSFLISLKTKKQKSDFIIDNNQNKRKVKENVKEIWSRIKRK
ncbi:MAG: dephospho-CoA kinase [Candidatus Saelkia tenebricola]|nr:dephospho-CoA kinase [Candidatus Saelkia tenebricola]